MTQDDMVKVARECGIGLAYGRENIERFYTFVAAEKEQQMIRDGYRKCAEGQRTTQFCGLLDAAVKAEREACAKVAESYEPTCDICPSGVAIAIRARGET